METNLARRVVVLLSMIVVVQFAQCTPVPAYTAARPIVEVDTIELVVEVETEGRSCSLNGKDVDCTEAIRACQRAISGGTVSGIVVQVNEKRDEKRPHELLARFRRLARDANVFYNEKYLTSDFSPGDESGFVAIELDQSRTEEETKDD